MNWNDNQWWWMMSKVWKILVCNSVFFIIFFGCSPLSKEPPIESSHPAAGDIQENSPIASDPGPSGNYFPAPLEGRIPVIYSHGGGPCDIGGMVYLSMHPNVDFIGMVLTRGEIHPEIAIEKWPVFLYDVLNSTNTAIALGSDVRMDQYAHDFPEVWRRSADDFWELALPDQITEYEPAVGPDLIVELISNSQDKVTLVSMASMIDIALALQKDPGIIDNISHVVIMGGAFTVPGNLAEGPDATSNEVAEWNMWIDAQAAKYVLNSGVPLSIIPLDGIQYLIQQEDVAAINLIDDPGVEYVSQMWNQQWDWSNGEGFLIWDTITITAITNPENFFWTYDGVDVIAVPGDFQGQTFALNNGAQHTRYATGANYEAVIAQLFDVYRGETQLSPPPSPDVSTESKSNGVITELAGTWEGFTGDFHITIYLKDACVLNEKCGTFEIPEFSLTGDISFVNVKGNKYEFKATNISTGQSGNDYEYLEILSDGTLKYFTQGGNATSEAILERE